jgi:hypothetical protein
MRIIHTCMKNFWIERATQIIEEEVQLLEPSSKASQWFAIMGPRLPTYYFEPEIPGIQVGWTHSIRLTRLGIEGVIRAARKYHRYNHRLHYHQEAHPDDQFWVVLEHPHLHKIKW